MRLKYATVLIVGDESMLLDIFREWLEEENYRTLTAEYGAIAVQILRRHHVDVIVSDVRMPVITTRSTVGVACWETSKCGDCGLARVN